MGHERLEYVKNTLMDIIEEQMSCLETVCTKELGEAVDMVKDLEEAIYYHTITQAMSEEHYEGKKEEGTYHGVSHIQRHAYMEAKQKHNGKAKQLQELERYMKDLTSDLMEMIEDSSPEEKQYLGNRLSTLATKIIKLDE